MHTIHLPDLSHFSFCFRQSSKGIGFGMLTAIALSCIVVSCSTPEDRHSKKIERIAHIGSAKKKTSALADSLATAEAALATGLKSPEQKATYQHAVEDVVTLWMASKSDASPSKQLSAQTTNTHYQLNAHWPKNFRFDNLILARSVKMGTLRKDIVREGVGVPYIANWKSTPERESHEPFMSKKGYFASVTITIDFKRNASGTRIASLVVHNANTTKTVSLSHHNYTLAYNQSALAEYILSQKNEFSALGSLVRPQKYLKLIGLKSITPPDPSRVPVIFVHGLASEPRTWQNVYNELRADPVIREKCQIYFFRYPTGVPVLYSAAKLREELTLLHSVLSKNGRNRMADQMLLVGHSMGGLVTKTQVQNSGDQIWLSFKEKNANRILLNDQQTAALRHYLEFKPNPYITRVIFVATPHKGSGLADLWIVRQMKKLIQAPFTIVTLPMSVIDRDDNQDALDKLYQSGIPTSMDNLSPSSDYVQKTTNLPLRKGLKIHSIVGNLKGLDLSDPECSDGVVPYSSSHIPNTVSELVVPYGHSAHEHPLAIKEIQRIIRLHLKELN